MGHISPLRNQFKSVNTFAQSYYYIMRLIWREENQERRKQIISFFMTKWSLFVKSGVPFNQGYLMPGFIEIGPVVLKKILNFHSCLFANS